MGMEGMSLCEGMSQVDAGQDCSRQHPRKIWQNIVCLELTHEMSRTVSHGKTVNDEPSHIWNIALKPMTAIMIAPSTMHWLGHMIFR